MINSVELKNFGPIEQLDWQNLSNINLIIGNNGCGKSFLLKALYSAVRTLEDYKRGNEPRTIEEILRSYLHWTFQAERIGDLVTVFDSDTKSIIENINWRNIENRSHVNSNNDFEPLLNDTYLVFNLTFNQQKLTYCFDYNGNFQELENKIAPRSDNSIFLSSKETPSLHHIILKSRHLDKVFGFDDTYFDLAMASQYAEMVTDRKGEQIFNRNNEFVTVQKSVDNFKESRSLLENIINGRIEFDNDRKRWYFINKAGQRFPMGITAEGIRKIGILEPLLSNRYLNENSIVFIDEPESNLHPTAISQLLDIIALLAEQGMQIFLASHSYFVVKKLFLIAQEKQLSIPVLSYQDKEWVQSDLKDDMPSNPIISESIRLYKEEMFLASR
jgi:AAA15 family ATPase/GTPase